MRQPVVDPDRYKPCDVMVAGGGMAGIAAAGTCLDAGVRLLLRTTLDEVVADGGHVEHAVVLNKAGRSALRAAQFVDETPYGVTTNGGPRRLPRP